MVTKYWKFYINVECVILHGYENEIRIIGLLIWLCFVKELMVEISLCMLRLKSVWICTIDVKFHMMAFSLNIFFFFMDLDNKA